MVTSMLIFWNGFSHDLPFSQLIYLLIWKTISKLLLVLKYEKCLGIVCAARRELGLLNTLIHPQCPSLSIPLLEEKEMRRVVLKLLEDQAEDDERDEENLENKSRVFKQHLMLTEYPQYTHVAYYRNKNNTFIIV